VLVKTVREAHKVFLSEHNSVTIGKSKFATLRPQNVLSVSDKNQTVCKTVCCYRYHENLQLLLDGLKKCFTRMVNYPCKKFSPTTYTLARVHPLQCSRDVRKPIAVPVRRLS